MYKIRKISIEKHPILGDLTLDFCDNNGNAVDTVIFAGENGCGKSTIINFMYDIITGVTRHPVEIEIEENDKIIKINYFIESGTIWAKDANGLRTFPRTEQFKNKYNFAAIYSDVDINFHSQEISSVTSLDLDNLASSRKSSKDLPKEIKQLLIDIQALDDSDIATAYEEAKLKGEDLNNVVVEKRMNRFTKAFEIMFDTLKYKRIVNTGRNKNIIFNKNGVDISLEDLSSGEKQIVYRGCFLLKDINAINGAFVFIDEPEISLHPVWQEKIMNYYINIFTNEEDKQTSQIFAVTHSPFIIHNDNRKNDKVIVLTRDNEGKIIVKDNPEYYHCTSTKAIEDAFTIRNFSADKSMVYLEGRTDEKYFNKALEVFGYDVPFQFKWVGYIDDNGNEAHTGDKSVDQAFEFLVARNLPIKNFCLKDCDTKRERKSKNNVTILSIPPYENSKNIKKGIENALVLDGINIREFYKAKERISDYGEIKNIEEFDKMACCDAICGMRNEELKEIFQNLKTVIDELVDLYENN